MRKNLRPRAARVFVAEAVVGFVQKRTGSVVLTRDHGAGKVVDTAHVSQASSIRMIFVGPLHRLTRSIPRGEIAGSSYSRGRDRCRHEFIFDHVPPIRTHPVAFCYLQRYSAGHFQPVTFKETTMLALYVQAATSGSGLRWSR